MNLKAPEAATSGKPGREDSNLRPMGPASFQTALPRNNAQPGGAALQLFVIGSCEPNPPPGCNTWQEYIEKEDHNRHIRNRTGDQEATLPPTTGGICRCTLEANQGDK